MHFLKNIRLFLFLLLFPFVLLAASADEVSKKRFLIICENFEIVGEPVKVIGGVEKVILQVTDILQERNFDVEYMDVPLDTFTVPGTEDLQSPYPWGIKAKIAQKIFTFKPDYIFIPLHGVMSYQAATYCFNQKIPFTAFYPARLTNICKSNFHIPMFISNYFVNDFLSKASRVLVPAFSMQAELEQQGIKNVVAWPHGVELERFSLPTMQEKEDAIVACGLQDKPHPFYLYVARLSPEKNIQGFLDVKVPGTKILVGPEDMGYKISDLQQKYPDIVITGPKKGKNLLNYYHSADIFLFTSKQDSFGLVMLEALATGLPVVGFNTCGPMDVVPQGRGVSYLANNDDELQQCALFAWEDLQAGIITHEQCQNYAKNFTWDVAVDSLLENMVQIDPAIYENKEAFQETHHTALWVAGGVALTAGMIYCLKQ